MLSPVGVAGQVRPLPATTLEFDSARESTDLTAQQARVAFPRAVRVGCRHLHFQFTLSYSHPKSLLQENPEASTSTPFFLGFHQRELEPSQQLHEDFVQLDNGNGLPKTRILPMAKDEIVIAFYRRDFLFRWLVASR